MNGRRGFQSGFTLLELVLVLMIISTALAVAAPSLRGWSKGAQLRDSADEFLSVARWARMHAIADSQVHRITVDRAAGRYWATVQNGSEFVAPHGEFGQQFKVPDGCTIAMADEQRAPLESVDFFPTGRATPALVRIEDNAGAIEIECPSPAEGFRLVSAQQEQR